MKESRRSFDEIMDVVPFKVIVDSPITVTKLLALLKYF
ncbi:MAG: hypothetical protein Ct9H300mP3_02660 [Gammaproteobacteria bacterium]|nr:MAG: hypothetical protein Ct9H300mP3_02660 [Gammaproteobacteria bacterium]